VPDIDDLDDDNDAIVDSFDDNPLTADPMHLHEFTIEINNDEMQLEIIWKVDTGTSTAYASLADFMTHMGVQPDGTLDSQEQDALENAMCESPSMYNSFTFEELVVNITIEGYMLTVGEIDCAWIEKEPRPASELRSETLIVTVPFQINGSVNLPFTFTMSGEEIPRTCMVTVEYGSKDIAVGDFWWPWYENYSVTYDENSGTTSGTDNTQNGQNNDESNDDVDDSSSESASAGPGEAAMAGAMCMVVGIMGVALYITTRRSKKKNQELQYQVNQLLVKSQGSPHIVTADSKPMEEGPPHPQTVGVVGSDGYEWIDHGDSKWYRVAGSGGAWLRDRSV
jgi:hypothetical protein